MDEFYLDQNINDLQDTADAEDQLLQDKLDSLDLYLKSLQYSYSEEERINRDRLLAQLMNLDENMSLAEKQKAIHDTIISDWKEFNLTCEGEYKNYNGEFSNFLDDYTQNMVRLAELRRQQLEILSAESLLDTNDWLSQLMQGITTSGDIANAIEMTDADKAMLDYAGRLWNQGNDAGNQELMDYAHDLAESIRAKYGFSGGDDGSGLFWLDTIPYENNLETQSRLEANRIQDLVNFLNKTQDNYNWEAYLNDQRNGEQADNLSNQQKNYLQQSGINSDIVNNWIEYNKNSSTQYDLQTMEFDNFLSKYASQIAEYADLQSQLNSLQGSLSGLENIDLGNLLGSVSSGGSYDAYEEAVGMSAEDKAALDAAGAAWNAANAIGDAAGMEAAHAAAEAIRNKYGYSGGSDGGGFVSTGSSGNKGSSSSSNKGGSSSNKGSSSSNKGSGSSGSSGSSNSSSSSGVTYSDGSWSPYPGGPIYRSGKSSYAGGLENGPVTYTGLAMLHGSPTSPEYVLNNDQAYNLLYNLSASRMAPYESVATTQSGDTWNLYGDINLEDVNDPAEFWQSVMNSAGNKWNTTKNKRS